MSRSKKFITAALIATALVGATSSASAVENISAAIARAQTHAAYTAEMDTFIASNRAIVDAYRAAVAKAQSDFQTALTGATTNTQLKAARDARKAAIATAAETSKAAKAALVKPVKPVKAAKPVTPKG